MLRLASGHYLSPIGARRAIPAATLIETVYSAGMRLPRHSHEFPYLVLMIDGTLRERTLGRTHDLGRGSIVFNDAGESHENELIFGSARCLNVELRTPLMRRLADEGLRIRESVLYTHAGAAMGAIARLYAAAIDPGPDLEVEESLVEILAALACRGPRSPRGAAPWIRRVLDALHDAAPDRPTLADLADLAGVQQVHLCRAFRAAVGCTIGEYARRLRVAQALAGVTRAEHPLVRVAHDAGFADQAHMTRAFTRHIGRSPGRLRRLAAARTFRSRPGGPAVLY